MAHVLVIDDEAPIRTLVRQLSYLLHPPFLEEMGLASALGWYTEGFTRRSSIKVTLEVPPEFSRLSDNIELVLFRIVQESLTNGSPMGVGIAGMHERVRQLGGQLEIYSGKQGTTIMVTLPVEGGNS